MARVLEEYRREREVPCRNNTCDQAVPETIFRNAEVGESERGGGGGMQGKELFTVYVKDSRIWTSERLLSEKLKDLFVDLQHNAGLLQLIDPDELIVGLVLVRSEGANVREIDMASTLCDIRVGLVAGDMLVALLSKTTPSSPPVPAIVPFTVEGYTTIAEQVPDNLLYASASANAQPGAIKQRQSKDRAMKKSLGRPSSSVWASMAPSLPIVPSWSKGKFNSQHDHIDHVGFMNAMQSLPGVQVRDFTESSLNSHDASFTQKGRAQSQTNLKSTRNKLGVCCRPRLRGHDYQTYFAEAFAYTTTVLQEAEELLERLQRWEQRSVDHSNVDLTGAGGEMVRRDGDEIVETSNCLEE